MWKDRARPFVRPLPQWSTVAVASPQQAVTATLRWDDTSADVSADHTVASLVPLVIASSLDGGAHPVLEYNDRASGSLLGVLHLTRTASVAADGTSFTLYHVSAGEHRCLGWPLRPWNAWLQNRLMRKNRSPEHFAPAPVAVQQLMIAYLPPRPVVLVSVDAPGHRNLFPMDLIGPLQRSGLFLLALRTNSASVAAMRDVRRVALSHVPATMKSAVYKLAEHHKQPLTDWDALPFPVRPSREYGVPAVASALRIQELAIVHSQEVGSHMLFVGRTASDDSLAEGAQLHHTAGFHQAWRRRRGMPFAEV